MSEINPMLEEPPITLEELTALRSTIPAWLVEVTPPEIGGGKLAAADLDAISLRPDATALRVSGLDQSGFEALVERHGPQFTALQFWECPRIQDFSPLESLPDLAVVSIFSNQRTSRLWNLAKTPKLRGLEFAEFSRLPDLDDLANAQAIEELSFGDRMWARAGVASLEPLRALATLRRLEFAVRKIADGRIQPLADLPLLERLDGPSNLFTTEQLAWLRAHLPDSVEGRLLAPIELQDEPDWLPNRNGNGPDRDVLVMGKRRPFLNSRVDAAKVQRYVDDYWKLVARFRQDPALEPASP